MNQKKEDGSSTSFSIETSGLDADDDDSENRRSSGTSGLGSRAQKKHDGGSSKKNDEEKMKQKKKEDGLDFKIEETVATPEMIKHLVGDNTPDEEEEPAPVAAKKQDHPAEKKM